MSGKLRRWLREGLILLALLAGAMQLMDVWRAPQLPASFDSTPLQTLDGETVTLAALSNEEPVLIYFWASWCGPCRSESPHIAELYNTYKDKGLTVLGVAVWDKPENTKKAIKELNIDWPQIIDTGMTPMDLYGVKGIPFILLFGPDGTIIARDLRGEGMKNKVAEVLNNK